MLGEHITQKDLDRLAYLRRKGIDNIRQKKNELRYKASGLAAKAEDAVRTGTHHDKMSEYMVRLEELEQTMTALEVEAEELEVRVMDAIHLLPGRQAEVIYARLIARKGWKKIARETSYSVRSCQRAFKEGLKEIL